jgi:endonuclease/exonuclease/phosphatase family metal-dependent hydrolase
VKKITKSALYLFNWLVVILFLIAASAKYISPEIWLIPSYVALGFPYLFVLNVFFVVFWFYRLNGRLFVSLIVLFAGWGQFLGMFQISFTKKKKHQQEFNIVSHNLRAFGLNGPKFETTTGTKIFKYYKNIEADVFCFQEFFNTSNFKFSPKDSIKKSINSKYEHIEYVVHFRGNDFGLATFSKYPIVNKGVVKMPQQGTNLCIFSDIDFGDETIRFYNFHLASIHFREAEYKYIEEIDQKTQDEHLAAATSLFTLIGNAFEKRAIQAEIIKKHVENSPFPVVVCGDLNDTPNSYAYHALKKGLDDTFEQKGMFLGNTYNGKLPPLRIDFMLVSPRFEVYTQHADKIDLSDHYPIFSTLQ